MKKLFAILMVLALVAGSAFAQVGGAVLVNTTLLSGDTTEKADGDSGIYGDGGLAASKIVLRGDAGEYGGFLRVNPSGHWTGYLAHANAWWKPVDQFLIRLGTDPDGFWNKQNVTGWMFHRDASDLGVGVENWGFGAFYGGFDGWGLMLEIKPIDILAINVALPYFGGVNVSERWEPKDANGDWIDQYVPDFWTDGSAAAIADWDIYDFVSSNEVGDIFKALTLQVDVNLDFGNIALTYVGDPMHDGTKDKKAITMGQLYFSVGLGVIPNVDLNIGATFVLPGEKKGHPITAGIGATISATDELGIRTRLQATLGGNADEDQDDSTSILFDIMPYYAFSDNFTGFFYIGLDVNAPKEGDTVIGWTANPYIQVGSEWGPSFWAGVKLWSAGGKDPITNWAVPIGITFGF